LKQAKGSEAARMLFLLMSKRKRVSSTAGSVLSGLMFLTVFSVFVFSATDVWAADTASSSRQEIDTVIARIEARSGFDLVYQQIPTVKGQQIAFSPASPEDFPVLLGFLKIFEEEIQKYPSDCLIEQKGQKIYFVKTFFFGEILQPQRPTKR